MKTGDRVQLTGTVVSMQTRQFGAETVVSALVEIDSTAYSTQRSDRMIFHESQLTPLPALKPVDPVVKPNV